MLTALVSVLALGFLLGMRHATDPDHVVAVTTIVTQQRSLGRAARTGMLWGLGHTTTILLVGGAIVAASATTMLLNAYTPAREYCPSSSSVAVS